HERVERDASRPAQPGFDVLDSDPDVEPQPFLRPRALRYTQEVRGGRANVLTEPLELIRTLHVRLEDFTRDRHQTRMRDPRSVVAVTHLAELVRADLLQSRLAPRFIVLDRDLGGHPAHGMD